MMISPEKYPIRMAAALLLILLSLVGHIDAGAANRDATEGVGGTIPIIQRVSVSGEGYPDLFSSIDIEDFSRGFKETKDGRVLLAVLSNAPWRVSVRAHFKPVGSYLKPASDLLVKIREMALLDDGAGSGGRFAGRFVDFGALSDKDQLLWAGDTGGDHYRARIDYRLLLSPVRDIAGDYLVTVTYTIGAR